jgi:hypothetical protein
MTVDLEPITVGNGELTTTSKVSLPSASWSGSSWMHSQTLAAFVSEK